MDQSALYNLRNPAFVEDIGHSMINQMYPTTAVGTPGMINPTMPGRKINPGQPQKDSFESDKVKKERNFISKVLLFGVIALAGLTIYKKSGVIAGKITDLVRKAGTKIVSAGKSLGSKIKKIFKK